MNHPTAISDQVPAVTSSAGWSIRRMDYEPAEIHTERVAAEPTAITADIVTDPAARTQAHRLLTMALEVIDGRRSPSQLAPLMGIGAGRYLLALVGPRRTQASRLLSMRVSQPVIDGAEVAALVRINGRRRAVAARFDRGGELWRCTVLRVL